MGAGEKMTCPCQSVRERDRLYFCEEHHRFWRNDKQLASVTQIIKACWPVKPDFAGAQPDVLENARDRGTRLDEIVTEYIQRGTVTIPANDRKDAKELFRKAKEWVDQAPEIQCQRIVADDEVAGILDFLVCGNCIVDLKGSYNLEAYYPVQIGGYIELFEAQEKKQVEACGILHVTERFPRAKWVPLDVNECREDWRTLRRSWQMAKRRLAGG